MNDVLREGRRADRLLAVAPADTLTARTGRCLKARGCRRPAARRPVRRAEALSPTIDALHDAVVTLKSRCSTA